MIGKCVTCDHLNHALFGLPHLLSMPPLPELDVLKPWSNSFICASKRLPSLSLVRALVDPQGRGRQHIAARLQQLVGTRAGGFALTREEAAGRWGAATYSLSARDVLRPLD